MKRTPKSDRPMMSRASQLSRRVISSRSRGRRNRVALHRTTNPSMAARLLDGKKLCEMTPTDSDPAKRLQIAGDKKAFQSWPIRAPRGDRRGRGEDKKGEIGDGFVAFAEFEKPCVAEVGEGRKRNACRARVSPKKRIPRELIDAPGGKAPIAQMARPELWSSTPGIFPNHRKASARPCRRDRC